MKRKQPKFKYVFLWVDIIILTMAFILSATIAIPDFWATSREQYYYFFSHFSLYLILLAVFLFSFRYNALYARNVIITHYRQFVLIIKSLLYGSIISVILMAIFNVEYLALYGKDFLIQFIAASCLLFLLFRAFIARNIFIFTNRKNIYQQRVLVVGGGKAGKYAIDSLARDKITQFTVVGVLDDYKKVGETINDRFDNLGRLKDIQEIVDRYQVNEILIAIDNAPYERMIHIVEACLETSKPVRIYSNFLHIIAEKMKVEYYSTIPVVELPQYPLTGVAWTDKRTFDVIYVLVALILLSPLLLVIAVGIKLSSKGPVFFKQTRIGKNGRPFDFYKFRSMHVGTDNSKHKEYVTDFIKNKNSCENKNIEVFKITDDPRIFKLGKFIRKTSLDEFPQLFNVLKGDMTLVGPRPCLPYEWECYDDWHKNRLNVLPGCTGLWQALGRSSVTFEEMVILDLYYISNMSLWLDFKIVIQTFPVIFFGKGGY